jgi:hypothetical protein
MAKDGSPGDAFGSSLAMEHNTLVVGASGANSSGAAYVYVRQGGQWRERQKLLPSDAIPGGRFGASVALRAGVIVVGAPQIDLPAEETSIPEGNVYVFLPHRGGWFESQKLNGGDQLFFATFGTSVAMGRGMVAVGAPIDEAILRGEGAAFVFEWVGQELTHGREAVSDEIGAGRDLDFWRRRVIVGLPGTPPFAEPGSFQGSAAILEYGESPAGAQGGPEPQFADEDDENSAPNE